MARALVTGGAGFIGSHLCDALIAAGHTVLVVDDLSSGHAENLSQQVEFVRGDCADVAVMNPLIAQVDVVFHLAAIASVPRSVEAWSHTSEVNQLATIRLLEMIQKREGGVIPFIYASSAAIYGDPPARCLPLDEWVLPAPLTPYGADKLGSELHAAVARYQFQIPTLGLRFFNVFGPRQDPASPYSGVISIFARQISAGNPVTMFGDGLQSRDFIYVVDVVQHLLAAWQQLQQAPMALPVALNVCTGHAITIQQLAEQIAALCDQPLTVTHAPARRGDIRDSLGNPAQATAALGYRASTPLSEGLRETLAWMQRARAQWCR